MLEEVKSYLKISTNRENAEIERLLEGGKRYLSSLTGTEIDYGTNGFAKQLLFDYCRYVRNGAFEFYEENFRKQLLRLQMEEAVNAFRQNGVR